MLRSRRTRLTHRREFGWVRQIRRNTIVAEEFRTDEEKREIVNGMEALGFEEVRAPALYDNGDFIVIDTVKDLSFAVCRVRGESVTKLRDIPLDKYEAIRVADEFKEALDGSSD